MREKKLVKVIAIRMETTDVEKIDQIAHKNRRNRTDQLRKYIKDGIESEK
ncbi:MAG: hypothetical protein WCJ81_09040 [bacterium]